MTANKTWVYTYDRRGNILSRKTYAYTTGTLGTVQDTDTYEYFGQSSTYAWGDVLLRYDGIDYNVYDAIGNPTRYMNVNESGAIYTFSWQNGRQLASGTKGETTFAYTYNADGLRTKKVVDGVTTEYYWAGSQLAMMIVNPDLSTKKVLKFYYDAEGRPIYFDLNGTTYFYVTNLQGDVVALTDSYGEVVSYQYDAWGKPLATDYISSAVYDAMYYNPLRYRGYIYDNETGFYYLQSRYYDPVVGRFINSDGYVSTGTGVLGYNMFAYCLNNPMNKVDYEGNEPGDLFDTMDEAALDFAMCYNELSIADMQEYGSAIYMVTKVNITYPKTPWYLLILGVRYSPKVTVTIKYSYTKPSIGKNGSSVIPNFSTIKPIVSTVHTHANYDPEYNNESFSTKGFLSDIGLSNFFHMDSYVVTPGGYLKKYTYANRKDSNGGVTVISNNIPWDPNSPDHK